MGGVSGVDLGGGCVFFANLTTLGLMILNLTIWILFPNVFLWRQGSLIQSEGEPIFHGIIG